MMPMYVVPLSAMLIVLPFAASVTAGLPPLIPVPVREIPAPGKFTIDAGTKVVVDAKSPGLDDLAQFLAAHLRRSTGYQLSLLTGSEAPPADDAILLSLAPTVKVAGTEGYALSVTPRLVTIAANAPAGVFYGMQTFFQLLPSEFEFGSPVYGVPWDVPCIAIEDAPRFPWRGMHLDVGRHFFPKQFVKRYIDLIARYKFNVFHWHLTEDQGWRIEIKKYPKLTEIGSWRKETLGDGRPHGGFYTQDDIREVVAYAKERYVTIIPEIEMPGHSMAALAAYPGLSCTGGPFQVQTGWGVFNDVYCAGNDHTFEFLQDVLAEVMQLFPGPYIHCGGDECPKTRWKACPRCQARMKAEGLATEHELQSYFIRRIEEFVNAGGKRLIGWDEILEGGLAPNATVMSWRGTEGGIAAAKAGHDVVMTPTSYCYFDYYQGLSGEPEAAGGFLPLEQVYAYEPVPEGLTAEEGKHILGAQGNVWTESIPDERQVEYMAFPRACALSEVVWSPPGRRDFRDFSARLADHFDRLLACGVNVRISPPAGFEGSKLLFRDTTVSIANAVPGSVVRYTTDGSQPTADSRRLLGPVPVPSSMILKARTFLADGAASPVATGVYSLVDPASGGIAYRVFRGAPPAGGETAPPAPVDSGSSYTIEGGFPGPAGERRSVVFDGFLLIAKAGLYTFSLGSTNPARLSIDRFSVASTADTGRPAEASGRILLATGSHRIGLVVSDVRERPEVRIEGPGLERQPIPAFMLRLRPL